MFRVVLLLLLLGTFEVRADGAEKAVPAELQAFEAFSDILPVVDEFGGRPVERRRSRQQEIIPFIKSSLAEAAVQLITAPEQVFCYHVAKREAGYEGYTLDNFAVTGFCGELDNSQTATSYEALFTQSPNILTSTANCRIEPRLILRFVRGVDSADVLLSSPCPSFTVFYAGKYKSFNIKQGVIDDIIGQLEKKKENFNSPTFLKQAVGNGVATTNEDAERLEKQKREEISRFDFKQDSSAATTESSTANVKKSSGWGKGFSIKKQ